MTRPNCMYDDAEHTFFHCERWRLERMNFEAKVAVCTVENFCDILRNSEENWNTIATDTEALLKSKKSYLDERIEMDV